MTVNWETASVLEPGALVMVGTPDGPAMLAPPELLGVGSVGPQGPAGPAGADGATGPQGIQGVQGATGVTNVATAKNSANTTNSTVTPVDCTGLAVTLTTGRRYTVQAHILFQTAATTTGIGFNFTGPAMTSCGWRARIQQAAAGTDQTFESTATALATQLVSASVIAANTTYLATIEGVFAPSATGALQLQVRSEVAGSQCTVLNGSAVVLIDCG